MKKRVLIDLPDNFIDTETKKIIQALQKEIKKLKSTNLLLVNRTYANKCIVEKAQRLIEAIRSAGDFCPEWCEGDRA